ncbi:hypothetical protein [Pseudomonas mangiferae]|uniref:Uncharacterized protein n=1 Tax=Pseudomonas mangiferae TaxID=2593654 RepID=A0A553H496_9PSED|nr:hypothetical protein [Pseudomonas mangiferae]TRX76581.1 hypothetical protein FM069_00730 [Pseudomonas mangiferae]
MSEKEFAMRSTSPFVLAITYREVTGGQEKSPSNNRMERYRSFTEIEYDGGRKSNDETSGIYVRHEESQACYLTVKHAFDLPGIDGEQYRANTATGFSCKFQRIAKLIASPMTVDRSPPRVHSNACFPPLRDPAPCGAGSSPKA